MAQVLTSIDSALGVRTGRNSLPEAHAPKREVRVATRAVSLMLQLVAMQRALDARADADLIEALVVAQGALLKVQGVAGTRAVMVSQ